MGAILLNLVGQGKIDFDDFLIDAAAMERYLMYNGESWWGRALFGAGLCLGQSSGGAGLCLGQSSPWGSPQ